MSSTFGEHLKLSIFGQSHGPAIGMTLDGIPAGLAVDLDQLQSFLNRRTPGNHSYSTSRKEDDCPEFLSGIVDNHTCGAPIAAVIRNNNAKPSDYDGLKDCPRPGHADYTAQMKYNGFQDASGGGHFSGRLTAPLCIAGGLCKQWLEAKGIHVNAHIFQISDVHDIPFDPVSPQTHLILDSFPVISEEAGNLMQAKISSAKANGDSVGGVIECVVTGLPAGIGDPMFGGLESRISSIVYGIPAVKGVEFGLGFECASMVGSRTNDPFYYDGDTVKTLTNHAGGILGGVSNGMPLLFKTAIKPTPSIAIPQHSVSLSMHQDVEIVVKGRHDPCIVPRAVPVVEAACAIAIYDAFLSATNRR